MPVRQNCSMFQNSVLVLVGERRLVGEWMMNMASPLDSASPPSSPFIGQMYGEPRFHTAGDIAALVFGTDGTLWSIDETGVLQHWSAEGQLISRNFLSDIETFWSFSADARLLASANDDLLIWDVQDGQLLKRIEQPSWVTALGFSPDRQVLVSGHDDGTMRFWDTRTLRMTGQIRAHDKAVSAVAFSPNGEQLTSAGEDRIIRNWDSFTHKMLGEYKSHTDRIPALSWSADSSLFTSAGWDTSARVWKPGCTDPIMLLNSHAEQVNCVRFSPKSQLLATADSDFEVYLWNDPVHGKASHKLLGHTDEVRCLAFNTEGTRLASAGADRVIHLWDTATGRLIAGPSPHGKHGIAVFAQDGKNFLASTGATSFRLWEVESGKDVTPAGETTAYSVASSSDGRWLAVGGMDHFTRLHDRTGTSPTLRLEATKPPIGSIAFHPKGELLTHTSPADGLVWIWDPKEHEPKLILIEAADGCTLESVCFHPDGNRVAVGGVDYLSTGERDGAVCVWDLTTKLKDCTFDVGVYAVSFDPSGRYLAGAGLNEKVYVWDLTNTEQVFELEGHQGRINAVIFSLDGSYLVSTGDDLTLRVWDVLSGRLLIVREFDSPVQSLAFSPDGQHLFTGNGNTTCFRIDFKRLLED